MTKIKICGLVRIQDIEAVNEVLPDYIGFVFAKSRRQVSSEQATELRRQLDPHIKAAGVFVNAPLGDIAELCRENIIDIVQLHGDENTEYLSALCEQISKPVIKAVRVQSTRQITEAQTLPCDYLLLDTFQNDMYGGSGKVFDRSLIPMLSKPFFLAGGLDAKNIADAIADCHPYCIDVSSGAETDGMKDREKIRGIVKIVRGEE